MKIKGLEISATDSVYPPAEDSFLLAKHVRGLRGRVLDMGTGSGIQALTNAKVNPANEVIGVDINPGAVKCAANNAKANRIKNARFLVSDLFDEVSGVFDGIIFNPPYLPESEPASDLGKDAEIALSGGRTGQEISDRFIEEAGRFLKKGGQALLVQSSINDEGRTLALLKEKGYAAKVIDKESFFFEKIFVIRFSKKSEQKIKE